MSGVPSSLFEVNLTPRQRWTHRCGGRGKELSGKLVKTVLAAVFVVAAKVLVVAVVVVCIGVSI